MQEYDAIFKWILDNYPQFNDYTGSSTEDSQKIYGKWLHLSLPTQHKTTDTSITIFFEHGTLKIIHLWILQTFHQSYRQHDTTIITLDNPDFFDITSKTLENIICNPTLPSLTGSKNNIPTQKYTTAIAPNGYTYQPKSYPTG